MTTKILQCKCSSSFQDAKYGMGQRVHNAGVKDRRLTSWVCTVCGNKKAPTSAEKEELTTKKGE